MSNYIHDDDGLWEVLSYGVNLGEQEIPLESLQCNPARIDTCFECEVSFTNEQIKVLMEYYALHGRIAQILALRDKGHKITSLAIANAARKYDIKDLLPVCDRKCYVWGTHERRWSFQEYLDIINCTHYMSEYSSIMAAYCGNLKALVQIDESGSLYFINDTVIAAILGNHVDVFEWLIKKYPEHAIETHAKATAANYSQNPYFMSRYRRMDGYNLALRFNKMPKFPFRKVHGLRFINVDVSQPALSGNVNFLEQMRNKMGRTYDIQWMYVDAASAGHLKVLKWAKFRDIRFDEYFEDEYVDAPYMHREDVHAAAINNGHLKIARWVEKESSRDDNVFGQNRLIKQ